MTTPRAIYKCEYSEMMDNHWDEVNDIFEDIREKMLELGIKQYSHNIIALDIKRLHEICEKSMSKENVESAFADFLYTELPELRHCGWEHIFNDELYINDGGTIHKCETTLYYELKDKGITTPD